MIEPQPNPDPIFDPDFWRGKLYDSFRFEETHRAIFDGTKDAFANYHDRQRSELSGVSPKARLLDVGCGYGRLLDLLPKTYRGRYLGVDLSPDLVEVARRVWPTHEFRVIDLLTCPESTFAPKQFDVAVAVWVKTMMLRNGYKAEWERLKDRMWYWSKQILVVD